MHSKIFSSGIFMLLNGRKEIVTEQNRKPLAIPDSQIRNEHEVHNLWKGIIRGF